MLHVPFSIYSQVQTWKMCVLNHKRRERERASAWIYNEFYYCYELSVRCTYFLIKTILINICTLKNHFVQNKVAWAWSCIEHLMFLERKRSLQFHHVRNALNYIMKLYIKCCEPFSDFLISFFLCVQINTAYCFRNPQNGISTRSFVK